MNKSKKVTVILFCSYVFFICFIFNNTCIAQQYVQDTVPVYDYVQRQHVVFKDDFSTDKVGTFPHKWTIANCLHRTQTSDCCIVKKNDTSSEIQITSQIENTSCIEPDLGNSYVHDSFTLEYYFKMSSSDDQVYFCFQRAKNTDRCLNKLIVLGADSNRGIFLEHQGILNHGDYFYHKENIKINFNYETWHHFAIAVKKETIRIYLDHRRILNIYDCGYSPSAFFITCLGVVEFKNVRLATGEEINQFDNILTDKKFISHAINFDVNQSTIQQSSNNYIQQLATWLQQNPDINLEIDGHTDNTGIPAANQKLSEERADAVKNMLVSMGVNEKRLTTKGFGSSVPLEPNTTPEGKANNRRVEFIKL